MVVHQVPSSRRSSVRPSSARSLSVHGCLGFQLGRLPQVRSSVRLVASDLFHLFHQSPGTPCGALLGSGFSTPSATSVSVSFRRHHSISYLRNQGGIHSSTLNSVAQMVLCPCEDHHIRLLPQFIPGCINVLANSLSHRSQVLGSEWTLCHPAFQELLRRWLATIDLFATTLNHRLPVYFSPIEDLQSAGTDAMMQLWEGLQAYAFPPFGLLHRVLAKVRQSRRVGAHSCGSLLATTPLVSQPSGASGGCSGVPSTSDSPTSIVFTRTSLLASTRVNYQAKWTVYHAWCRRHGHSVSCTSVPKIASFLLYLRRSLALSYSFIASYCSMLSGVFHFFLPDLSSHFVLRDLRSFCLEGPLPSSRVPPWDLAHVLSFLRGPPFEPLSSCSLRDLTRKVLVLVSLVTARRVGELQVVFVEVSSSGDDLFLTCLPEFRSKSDSSARPLPRSFSVRSLRDFVGDLPEELLRCPVLALRLIFLVRLHFLLVLVLFLSLLGPLLVLFPRMTSAFSSGMSFLKRILWRVFPFLPCPCLLFPRHRLLFLRLLPRHRRLFLRLLPVLALLFACMGFAGWLLPGSFQRNAPLAFVLKAAS